MVSVRPLAPFSSQFFGGIEQFEMPAGNLFGLVEALDGIAPGFADEAALRVAFAVDGAIRTDWSTPLPANAEVTLFARVAGGSGSDALLACRSLAPFGVEIL